MSEHGRTEYRVVWRFQPDRDNTTRPERTRIYKRLGNANAMLSKLRSSDGRYEWYWDDEFGDHHRTLKLAYARLEHRSVEPWRLHPEDAE